MGFYHKAHPEGAEDPMDFATGVAALFLIQITPVNTAFRVISR